ncbi:hypothetical protein [Deinococcus multiflagellatus]|uniref:Uncharacterized protein n=1 Tax=Deinococcus multiflagellatus TaxID=1656887 RepID=A0ABW1ZEY0_9DEIO|nr:hypothetical protein [Deinococcus multiflagellatus]MBZ9712173.1 hypothetical protein [Deinococcus multiflagellatus]
MHRILYALLGAVALSAAHAQIPPLPVAWGPAPQVATPACRVEARIQSGPNVIGQYLVLIELPPICPPGGERLARILTRLGGRIPPIGYFRLSGGFPRQVGYWVFRGARVQDRAAPNVWVDVPIRGAPWRSN